MRLENCRLSVSMFHVCGLYVSCLRPLSTIHGYDKGRIAFWGARKRLGALAVLCGFERRACKHRGCEAGFETSGLGSCFWARAFWSCFSWFVLLVVLLVVLWVRSFRGSCFWFVLLGARMCFLFDALKFLEACVARSEVSKCKDSKKFAAMQIFTLKISCSPFGFSVVQGRNSNSHKRLRALVGRRENAFRLLRFIFNLQYVYGMFHCGLHKMFCFIQEMTQLSVSMWSLRSLVISHFQKKMSQIALYINI